MQEDSAKKIDFEFAKWLFKGNCEFIAGAQEVSQIPKYNLPEVAFAGLSNVGKSSLINSVTGQKALARTSKTPGRTQQINFFKLRDKLILVDLPGYGYAKVSKSKIENWGETITLYLKGRPNLRRVYILLDARRGMKDSDLALANILDDFAVNYQIILTKIDEVKESELNETIKQIKLKGKKSIALHPEIIATSSKNHINIDKLRGEISFFAVK